MISIKKILFNLKLVPQLHIEVIETVGGGMGYRIRIFGNYEKKLDEHQKVILYKLTSTINYVIKVTSENRQYRHYEFYINSTNSISEVCTNINLALSFPNLKRTRITVKKEEYLTNILDCNHSITIMKGMM